MSVRDRSVLVECGCAQAFDVRCRAARSGFDSPEMSRVAEVIIARRGVFVVRQGGRETVVDPVTPLIIGADDDYQVRHPVSGGDDCTLLIVPPALLEDAIGPAGGRGGSLRPADLLAISLARGALRDRACGALQADELSLGLLAAVSRAFSAEPGPRIGRWQRARVDQVRLLLAGDPAARWDLATVARAMQCSPFHLARQFRAVTGETISRYLLRLRLALAVERLSGGEDDLTALALDLGFAHHSHFGARFRSVFGLTPSAARESLSRSRIHELRGKVSRSGEGA